VGAGLLMGALVVWLASDTPSTPASEAPESTATVAPEPEPAAEEAGESPTRRPRRMTRTVNGEVERSVTRTSSSTRTNPEPGQDSEPEVDQEPLTDPGTVQAAAAPATTSTGSDPSPDPTSAPGSVQADSTAPGQTTSTNKNGKQLKGRLSNLIEQGENMAMSVDRAANNKTTFSVVGDAESVQLTSGFGSFSPGNIPVGHYVIRAVFPGSEAMVAGEVDVKRGANLVLHCSSSTQSCTRE
jgi:hypothetical protein